MHSKNFLQSNSKFQKKQRKKIHSINPAYLFNYFSSDVNIQVDSFKNKEVKKSCKI